MLGTIGQLLILTAFVSCGLAGFAFLRAAQLEDTLSDWKRIGRAAWGVMFTATVIAFGILLYLTSTHQFQYAYVYQYTSRDLPFFYLLSAAWAGQEGSFLLWTLLNGAVGLALIRWAREYEAPTLTVVSLCQVFLISMIVGLKIGAVPLGASPFITLAEKFPDAPVFQAGLIPTDGEGLNDLLQNYWMVIHPPTLFLGFSAMIVPFAFAIAALWKKHYTSWVRPALPWTLFAVMVLGIGIMMGGYWAYVTLSFGGYWAWDPVENSSLVPWIIGVAALHTMIIQKRSGTSHKAALFLCILAYLLVIYSTFLTRSGILGDISVHSFVDLGLYNQLLLWILTLGGLGFGLFAYRFRDLPRPDHEPELLSREFMIFTGAMLLCAIAAVVLLGTSTPILGRIFRNNPSSVPLAFYNKWTLPLSIGFLFLAGLGQLFWWHKMSVENINRVLLKPVVLSVVSTLAVLFFSPFVERTVTATAQPPATAMKAALLPGLEGFWATYGMGLMLLLLVFVAFFALYGNGQVLWRIGRGNPRLAGGAFAHVGLAVMVLGIVSSSGFSNPLGRNTGVQIGASRDNFIIEKGQTLNVDGYLVHYEGREDNPEGRPAYRLNITDPAGASFSVRPVVYKSRRNQWIQHPDLRLGMMKDLFVAVSPNSMFEDGNAGTLTLARGDSARLGDNQFTLRFLDFELNQSTAPRDTAMMAVAAVIEVANLATHETRRFRPVYLFSTVDGSVRYQSDGADDWGVSLTFSKMDVNTGKIELQVDGVPVKQEDWLVVQALEKPFINLVWFGFLMLSFGIGIALFRRIEDYRFSRSRT